MQLGHAVGLVFQFSLKHVLLNMSGLLREAALYQIGCFFTHCVKGRGVEPMCKNLCCGFVKFWRQFDHIKLTHKII